MKARTLKRLWMAFGAALILGGCGSGGTGGTGAPANSNYTQGQVQQFGSVYVNGIKFDIDSANITVDGKTNASQADLALGMVVKISGTKNGANGTAESVDYEDLIEGYVDQKIDANTMIVMGQTVQVDENTKFDSDVPDFASINVGDILEISGFIVGPGVVRATFVERKSEPSIEYEVHGFVADHDPMAKTLKIGALTVDYSSATVDDDLPSSGLWDGLLIEVEGLSYDATTMTLVATKVEAEVPDVADADEAEIEGFITAVLSADTFMIGSILVQTNASTEYDGGTAADVVVGAYVEVEGELIGGTLHAEEVEFKESVEIEGNVASIDMLNGTLTIDGLGSLTIQTNSLTEYENASSLADFAVGNHVQVEGRSSVTVPNTIIAAELKKESDAPNANMELRAPLDSDPVDPLINILSMTINTTGWPDSSFEDDDDNVIGRAGFFSMARANDIVKFSGTLVSGTAVWDSVELDEDMEDDDD